jgi:hypothetical protein
MKIGFRVDIQSDLSDVQLVRAKQYSDSFIISTLSDSKKRYGGMKSHGGRDIPFSRGSCIGLGEGLYFMRINRHKRIFGVVKKDTIEDNCEYGKLKFKIKPKTFIYAQIGDIKG